MAVALSFSQRLREGDGSPAAAERLEEMAPSLLLRPRTPGGTTTTGRPDEITMNNDRITLFARPSRGLAFALAADPFARLTSPMDRLFEGVFGEGIPISEQLRGEAGSAFTPRVDVREDPHAIRVEVELPGVDPKDVDVSLEGDVLLLRGEKKEERRDESDGVHRTERFFGSFVRAVSLPCEVQSDKAEARFEKGVLSVLLPKSEAVASRVKKIEIRSQA